MSLMACEDTQQVQFEKHCIILNTGYRMATYATGRVVLFKLVSHINLRRKIERLKA